jgi:hypothetical protein
MPDTSGKTKEKEYHINYERYDREIPYAVSFFIMNIKDSTREEEHEAFISLRAISSDSDYPHAEGAGSS